MKALVRILGAPTIDSLRATIERLTRERAEIEAQITALEGTRRTTAAVAADGDTQAQSALARANAELTERRQAASNLALALETRGKQLREAEELARKSVRERELAAHRRLLAERAATAQRIQQALEALAPELIAIVMLQDKIRLNYIRLGGRGPNGRGILVDEIEPGMVQRRMADFLFTRGVRQGLLGSGPFFLTGPSSEEYATAEAKAQRIYEIEN